MARSQRTRATSEAPGDIDALFRRYSAQPSDELHAELTCRFMPLVHLVARRYVRSGIALEDLQQTGCIGLMQAVTNFDPDRGVKFETYARHLIAGEIRHYLRDQGTVVRRPRWLYEMDHRLAQATTALTQRVGRPPTVEEIAHELQVEEEHVRLVLQARESLRLLSLDEEREGDDGVPLAPHDRVAASSASRGGLPVEERVLIGDAISRLSLLQRKVIYNLFYLDLTQTEAAQKLGISQKHVSRVMHAALRRLREFLRPEPVAVSSTRRA